MEKIFSAPDGLLIEYLRDVLLQHDIACVIRSDDGLSAVRELAPRGTGTEL